MYLLHKLIYLLPTIKSTFNCKKTIQSAKHIFTFLLIIIMSNILVIDDK